MFEINDRVWYVDNDPSDTGTVIEIDESTGLYWVRWDVDGETNGYSEDEIRPVE